MKLRPWEKPYSHPSKRKFSKRVFIIITFYFDRHYIHVTCAICWKTLYPRTCIPYGTRTRFRRLRRTATNLPTNRHFKWTFHVDRTSPFHLFVYSLFSLVCPGNKIDRATTFGTATNMLGVYFWIRCWRIYRPSDYTKILKTRRRKSSLMSMRIGWAVKVAIGWGAIGHPGEIDKRHQWICITSTQQTGKKKKGKKTRFLSDTVCRPVPAV